MSSSSSCQCELIYLCVKTESLSTHCQVTINWVTKIRPMKKGRVLHTQKHSQGGNKLFQVPIQIKLTSVYYLKLLGFNSNTFYRKVEILNIHTPF